MAGRLVLNGPCDSGAEEPKLFDEALMGLMHDATAAKQSMAGLKRLLIDPSAA